VIVGSERRMRIRVSGVPSLWPVVESTVERSGASPRQDRHVSRARTFPGTFPGSLTPVALAGTLRIMTFEAVFPPMPTPFAAGEVDVNAIRHNIRKWTQAGIRGVVALGSNGEAPLLDEDESDRVVSSAREALPPDAVLIAGTGRESTRATIAASRRAARLGANAVLVRTPSYFKSRMTREALVAHYTAVADESPAPVFLYNYPALTGVNLTPEAVSRLSEHRNIVGIKETGSDGAQLAALVDGVPHTFLVLTGSAPTAYASLCLGARGAILAAACIVPELCVQLVDHVRGGRHAEARAVQRLLTPLAQLVTTAHGVPGLKAAMDLAGYIGGDPRAPLQRPAPGAIELIRGELMKLQVIHA
jgi:4-hydroxy-2-oxoglutarate aldolase